MIAKRIQPTAWFGDEPTTHLLRVHARGAEGLQKLAAADSPLSNAGIKPEKGFAFVHVVTTGAGEIYGANNNADFFPKQASLWKYPNHLSPTRKEEMLKGGLMEFHPTFMKYGAVYREHNNSKKGAKPEGQIIMEAYNPKMDRGELIVKLGEDKWASELADLEQGRPVFWSMGCYTAGALVQMADGSFKEIDKILPGEYVVTHTGDTTEVTGARRLEVSDEIYTVQASGHLPLECTGNHEQYVVRREDALDKKRHFNQDLDVEKAAQWVRTDDLRVGDWMVCPMPPLGDEEESKDFAYLAGWYVAEGDLKYDSRTNSKCVRFSTGMSDPLHEEIQDICRRLGTDNPPRVYAEPEIGRRSVYVTDTELYDRLLDFGKGAKNKRLPERVFYWDEESLLAFLSGYLSGDGCYYEASDSKKNLYASTASKELALQLQVLGLSLGGFVYIRETKHYTSKSATTAEGYTISYQMRFDAELTSKIGPCVFKCTDVPVPGDYGKNTRRIQGDYALLKISAIAAEEMDTSVYNLHVASDDHSYLVHGLATHNCGVPYDICSMCGNHAKTRANYCQHMKYQKLAMDKEGNQVFAINDQPHFHDISRVVKPADRIAFGLAKVASQGAVEDCVEDISGLWLPLSVINKIAGKEEAGRAGLLDKLSKMEKEITVRGLSSDEEALASSFPAMSDDEQKDLTDKLASYPIESVLNVLNSKKVMLPPRAFACILLRKEASEVLGLEDMPNALRSIFSELKEAGDTDILQDGTYSRTFRGVGPSREIDQIASRFSLDDAAVRRRVIKSAVSGISKTACLATEASAESRYLAKEYAKYQLSFLAGADLEKRAHLVVLHNQVAT